MGVILYPDRGAVIYAGNNSLLKVICHRESKNGKVIGYEKLKPNRETCEQKLGSSGLSKYTMVRVTDGGEYFLFGPTKLHGASHGVYADQAKSKTVPGVIAMEPKPDGKGGVLKRGDSGGMFRCNAEALGREYSGTVVKSFANVHDDGETYASKGEAMDITRKHFLDTLREFRGKFDFFAYCGHGSEFGLPSACIGMQAGFQELVSQMKRILTPDATIIFYACSTGVEGGFAQKISREFPKSKVFAHLSARRGDNNPETVVIEAGKRTTFEQWLGKDGYQKWTKKVLQTHGDLYLHFPWMTREALMGEIGATANAA